MIGIEGLCFDTKRAVEPDWVKTTISFASIWCDAWTAALLTASGNVEILPLLLSLTCLYNEPLSAADIILAIISTDSIGYFPDAVSPDSITASVPSNMAFAISEASALVGLGLFIMDSSICVAVITGFPFLFAIFIMLFCATGTASGDISTPRSPLATITPSASSIIFSRFSMASGFSSLAITGINTSFFLIISLTDFTSLSVLTKEIAT